MARTRIRTSLATLAAAALLVTAGCGVDQSDNATEKVTSNDPSKIDLPGGDIKIESGSFEGTGGAVFLNRAAEATSATGTQKVWMEMEVTGIPEMGSMSIIAEGATDSETGRSHMTMDMGSMFGAMDDDMGMPADAGLMEIIVDGDTSYMKSGLFSMLGDSAKPWVKMDTADQGGVTSGSPVGTPSDPGAFLDYLKNSGGEIEELGTEEVRGVETTHIRTVLDMEDVMANAPAEDQADMQKQLDELGGSFPEIPVEAWVGEDGMVRRITMAFDFSELGDDEMGDTAMNLTIEMYDFGEPVDIEIPDASEVSDIDGSMMLPDN